MRGLSSLPAVSGAVYRGVPPACLMVVREKYIEGTDIYWSAFTSTSKDINRAKGFAECTGVCMFMCLFVCVD